MRALHPRIYLDHAATTPMLPAAREAVSEAMARWANPSSPHAEGRAARAALEDARARICTALGWSGTLIFTSGASEALALALGRAKAGPRYISAVEHDAVRRAAPDAAILPVSADGLVHAAPVAGVRPLVAVQAVNSETGVIQPLDEVAALVRERGGLLLADCAQSAGRLPLPAADFVVISAHKIGGPPGIGGLLVHDLAALDATGGQEQGYRQGTENLPGALGFAAAVEADRAWLADVARWRSKLDSAILAGGGHCVAEKADRLSTIASYHLAGAPSSAQLIRFDIAGIAVSAGSACSSGSLKPSPVLSAMGWDEKAAREVIRVSLGWSTTAADVDRFIEVWQSIAADIRARAA